MAIAADQPFIVCFVGLHGQGKTYAMSEALLEHQEHHWHIVSNYGFNGSELVQTPGELYGLLWRQAKLPYEERPPTAIGLDEASALFDNRDPRSFPEAMRLLLLMLRKLKIRLYYTTQDYADVDVKLRRVTGWVVRCKALLHQKIGMDDFTDDPIRCPRLFVRRTYKGGEKMPARAPTVGGQRVFFPFDPAVGSSYSHETLITSLLRVLGADRKEVAGGGA
jgi:hypothetical protein